MQVIDLLNATISVYDSLGGFSELLFKEIRKLLSWLESKSDRFKKPFQFKSEEVVKQMNGSDCGVFVCKYADYLLSPDIPLDTFNNSQYQVRAWLLDMLLDYNRRLRKDGLKYECKIQAMFKEFKKDMQGSLDNISSTCPPLPIVNKGAIKEFFTASTSCHCKKLKDNTVA